MVTGSRYSGVPPALANVPLRTVHAGHASEVYSHPRPQLARLARRGLLHHVARGYYVVVPHEHVGSTWLPSLEGASAGIAAATFGPRYAFLMGVSAARVHGAIPRALSLATVAAPRQRTLLQLTDRRAAVQFVKRDTARLDVEAVSTDLGKALVTSPEQTVLDIAHRPAMGGYEDEAPEAVRVLFSRCDASLLDELAAEQRLKAALARAREWTR